MNKGNIKGKNKSIAIKSVLLCFILLILLITIMIFTVPPDEQIESWIMQKYSIVNCDYKGECMKDNEKISFSSSHIRDTGIFTSYEIIYERDNGQMIIIRTLGILGTIYELNDDFIWEIVN
ncbi:hypothetical protein JOC85_001852 [Bacillus mesophilus]|uniref:Uncharacterized protein n=1 Tax=Bacillus mesophilus TaxID=1808955 RepID=A0A6M0Q4S3_9BACI|nr:hypothetical protein [Bacillus mesophilus]MBM7661080.1 hypothetical protein [Bacillus mesophilus]NEY71386.1 hypothetical protein [Bacillus mesophilus]